MGKEKSPKNFDLGLVFRAFFGLEYRNFKIPIQDKQKKANNERRAYLITSFSFIKEGLSRDNCE